MFQFSGEEKKKLVEAKDGNFAEFSVNLFSGNIRN